MVQHDLALSKLYCWLLHLSGMRVLLDLLPVCYRCLSSYCCKSPCGCAVLQSCRGRRFIATNQHYIKAPNLTLPTVQALARFVAAAAAAEPPSDLPELAQRLVMAQIQRALAATNLAVRQVC